MDEVKVVPRSFFELLRENCAANDQVVFSGSDGFGRYDAEAIVYRERDTDHVLETRRYFYDSGCLQRIAWFLNEGFGEGILRVEEWSEDGMRHQITSYAGAGEWLWERVIDHKRGITRTWVNRDSFIFFAAPEDTVSALEDGTFLPARLLDIRWADVREAILEILGPAKVIPEFPMETVDSLGPNRLLRMDWKNWWKSSRAQDWCFLELHCTTTGKVSYLRVPPASNDIMSAVAWTFRMQKEDYFPDQET